MILNIHQLRSFYHAAHHHSVSKAAQALMVTPPADYHADQTTRGKPRTAADLS